MLNVFVVGGALFLIGSVAVYAWRTRHEKPVVAAPPPVPNTPQPKDTPEQNAPESKDTSEQNAA